MAIGTLILLHEDFQFRPLRVSTARGRFYWWMDGWMEGYQKVSFNFIFSTSVDRIYLEFNKKWDQKIRFEKFSTFLNIYVQAQNPYFGIYWD